MAYSLVWLPQVLRDAGLKVVEQPGWQTRGHGDVGQIRGVLCHHTAGGKTGNAPSLGIVTNGRPDLAGPLAQLVLARDGTYYVIAAGLCWHAGAGIWQGITTGNSSFIGIEAENTGLPNDSPWPEIQMDAYRRGVAAILRKINARAIMCAGHKEYALPHGRKPDPDFDMVMFRAQVAAILGGTGPAKPPAPPVVPSKPTNAFDAKAPKIVRDLMADFGLTDVQAAGIAGNLGHESGGLVAFQEQRPSLGEGGYGWAQWTGPRRTQFFNFCKQRGLVATSDEANYGFLKLELQTTEKAAIAAVKRTADLNAAMQAFEQSFERAGIKHYDSRLAYAQRALNAYRAWIGAPAKPATAPAPPAPKGTGLLAWLASLVRRNA